LDILVYWNILTMHGPINVKSPNNISKWQMGFNSAFKGLKCLTTLTQTSVLFITFFPTSTLQNIVSYLWTYRVCVEVRYLTLRRIKLIYIIQKDGSSYREVKKNNPFLFCISYFYFVFFLLFCLERNKNKLIIK
jgi:hypothetical protein